MGTNGRDGAGVDDALAAAENLVEAYETEKLHVQGNFPDDKQRLKDIDAEIKKAKAAVRAAKREEAVDEPEVEVEAVEAEVETTDAEADVEEA